MQDIGEFLERLGKQISHMERRYGRHGGRFSEQFREQFRAHFGDGDSFENDREEEGNWSDTRELVFGEKPELRLRVNLANVQIRPVEPGGTARLASRGRDLSNATIETAEDGALEVKIEHSFFGGSQRIFIYIPAGTRLRATADLGSLSADGLTDGELDLRTEAGRLRVRDCRGRMRLVSNAGKMELQNCAGTLDARTSAGRLAIRDFTGVLTLRADAGSIHGSGLRLEPGEHTIEASMGSIHLGLVPDVPVYFETRANLGSVHNRARQGPADAPAKLRVHTEMGSIHIRYEEGEPTPFRRVPFTDERTTNGGVAAPGVEMHHVFVNGEPQQEPAASATPPAEPEHVDADADADEETLRILGMVERHEISAGEGAALLAAMHRGQ